MPFVDLKIGDHVEIRGTRDGTIITATEVKVESDGEDVDQNDDRAGHGGTGGENDGKDGKGERGSVEVTGTISALGGTCPTVNFMPQTTKVTTSASTTYDHTSCATLKDTLKVEVKGPKAADGSVAAARNSLDD